MTQNSKNGSDPDDAALDEGLEETFPASDPISIVQPVRAHQKKSRGLNATDGHATTGKIVPSQED